MESEAEARGSALLAELDRLLDEVDPLADELGIVVSTSSSAGGGGSGFLLKDHKLGVFMDAVPLVYGAAEKAFASVLPLLRKRTRDPGAEAELDDGTRRDALRSSRAVLLVCPDHMTAWNARKQLLAEADAAAEMNLLDLVLSKHPKCGSVWAHRRWVLSRWVPPFSLAGGVGDELYGHPAVQRELRVAERSSGMYPRNYYSWAHRHWLLGRLLGPGSLRRELESSRRWFEKHVSDFSGLHYRQLVLARVEEPGEILRELADANLAMSRYPAHEALWCYRRFLVHKTACALEDGTLRPPRDAASRGKVGGGGELPDETVALDDGNDNDNEDERHCWFWERPFYSAGELVRSELRYARRASLDDEVARFKDEQRFAWSHIVWVHHQSSARGWGNARLEQEYEDLVRGAVSELVRIWPTRGELYGSLSRTPG